uniref:Uncharacterized protein n=1 Tax=Timema poppense TaxID=170557 RepID=A0A7R9CMH6_TIMPO|nr:unnamed protein product [Timema poppensis]
MPLSGQCPVCANKSIAGNKQLDYMQAGRFCLFGCFFVAPTLHTWLTLARSMWPAMNIKTAIIKALLEQVTYTPFAYACFFFGMNLARRQGGSTSNH